MASKERLQQALERNAATNSSLPFARRDSITSHGETSCSNLNPLKSASGKLWGFPLMHVSGLGFWWLFSCILALTQSFLTELFLTTTFASSFQLQKYVSAQAKPPICQSRNRITAWWHSRKGKFLQSVWKKWEYTLGFRQLTLLCLLDPTKKSFLNFWGPSESLKSNLF